MFKPLLLTVVFAASFGATGGVRRYALRKRLIDPPGPRRSHTALTPHGGGLAIAAVFLCALLLLFSIEAIAAAPFLALFGGGLVVAVIGFWDDHKPVPVHLRLLVHFGAAIWALYWIGGVPPLPVGDTVLDLGGMGYVIGPVAIVWLLNLYNFMDGIDGLGAVEAIMVAGGACLVMMAGEPDQSLLWLGLLAAATVGFLPWNWPPARIFMGDVGSAFLGFTLGIAALHTAHDGTMNLWTWVILLGVFIVDATVTLITRIVRGDRWREPHRNHAYQLAAARCHSHRRVTLAVATINLLWLLPLAYFVNNHPSLGLVCACAALLPLLLITLKLGAGRPIQDARALP